MRRIDLFEFVNLGEGLRSARGVSDDDTIFDAFTKTYWLNTQLSDLLSKGLFEYGLIDHDCRNLISILEEIETKTWDEKIDNKTPIKSLYIGHRLRNSIQSFSSVLAAECRAAATYSVAKVGIYSTSRLVESASSGLSDDVKTHLSDEAKSEYDAAAKCLAFRLSTAAGFHMMRAVEFVLVPYVQLFSGRSFKSLNTNWGSYIDHLEGVMRSNKRRKPRKQTIDLLRQLKNNHRNPVMHADLVLAESEAQDIFAIGGVVVNALVAEMMVHSDANAT